MSKTLTTGDDVLHVGWARANGCGEIIFRQAGHPENDARINAASTIPWEKVYIVRRVAQRDMRLDIGPVQRRAERQRAKWGMR